MGFENQVSILPKMHRALPKSLTHTHTHTHTRTHKYIYIYILWTVQGDIIA